MERITKSQYLAIPKAYRGTFEDVRGDHPEWKGRRTAFLPGHGTVLFIEGVSFEIVDDVKHYAVCISDADGGSGEMKCTAKNKTEARQRGREYIKAWKLRGAKSNTSGKWMLRRCRSMKLKAELDGVQAVFQKNIDQIKAYAPRLKASGRRLARSISLSPLWCIAPQKTLSARFTTTISSAGAVVWTPSPTRTANRWTRWKP